MTLQAGAARVDITPLSAVPLFGYPHVRRISTGAHDPLLASALVLRSGGVTQAQIALDLLMLDPPTARRIRRRAADELGTDESLVFITCTHTHSGPVTSMLLGWAGDVAMPPPDAGYLAAVADRVTESVRLAANSLRPAELAWTTAQVEGVGCNRHDPSGVRDPEVGILAVRESASRQLMALATIYSMHPTVLHEDSTLISADFPYYAREALRERFGSDVVTVYHNGPSGNQSPRHNVREQTFPEAERLGRRLGEAVASAAAAIGESSFTGSPALSGVLKTFEPIPRALPSVEKAERTLSDYRAEHERLRTAGAARADVRTAECAIFGAEGAGKLARAAAAGELASVLDAYLPFQAQGIRIGDACLIGLPGELFTEYAIDIKRAAPKKIFVAELVNGHMQGYITTPEAAAAGGYEAAGAVFDHRTGAVMVRTAIEIARELGTAG